MGKSVDFTINEPTTDNCNSCLNNCIFDDRCWFQKFNG